MRPGKIRDISPAFNSEVKRFSGMIPKEKLSPIRGPGYYDPPATVSDVYKNKSSSKLFAESRRFEHGSYIEYKKAKEMPGPG